MKQKIKQISKNLILNRKKIWIYGTHSVKAVIENPERNIYDIKCIEPLKNKFEKIAHERGIGLHVVNNQLLFKLLKHHNHQGIAVCCDQKKVEKTINQDLMEDHSRIVILDRLTDVNNVGSIMRSMAAMGFTALITAKYHSPELEKCGIKSSCGGLEHISLFEISNIAKSIKILKKLGFWVIGLDHRAKKINTQCTEDKIALVIGSEGYGMRDSVLNNCDETVALDTEPDFPVLNASIATAVCMYFMRKNDV